MTYGSYCLAKHLIHVYTPRRSGEEEEETHPNVSSETKKDAGPSK
jgi:hypothetical protein